jgi:hypothetical protein
MARLVTSTDPLDSSTIDQHPLYTGTRESISISTPSTQEFLPAAASSRTKLTPEDVTPDVTGIRRLMVSITRSKWDYF